MRKLTLPLILIISLFLSISPTSALSFPPKVMVNANEVLFEFSYVSPMYSWLPKSVEVTLYSNNELYVRNKNGGVTRYKLTSEKAISFITEIKEISSREKWGFIPIFDASYGVFSFPKGPESLEFGIYAPFALSAKDTFEDQGSYKNRVDLRNWLDMIDSLKVAPLEGFTKLRDPSLLWEISIYKYEPYGEGNSKVSKWPFLLKPSPTSCTALGKFDSRKAAQLRSSPTSYDVVYSKTIGTNQGFFSFGLNPVFPHLIPCAKMDLVI
jgi:hypothetical protein